MWQYGRMMNKLFVEFLYVGIDVESEADSEKTITEKEEKQHCSKCGRLINEGDVFCAECGTKIKQNNLVIREEKKETSTLVCKKCGYPIDRSDRYCPNCGDKISAQRVQKAKREAVIITPTDTSATSKTIDQDKSKKKSTKVFGIICAVVALIIMGFVIASKMGLFHKEESYLTKAELDSVVNDEFVNFIINYNDNHTDYLNGYLTDVLNYRQMTDHSYDYYYVYLVGNGLSKRMSFEMIRFSIIANPGNKYQLTVQEKTGDPIYLKSVNASMMNIRKEPSLSGEIVGSLDTGQQVKVRYLDYKQYENGDNYVWYSINSSTSKWIADGFRLDKDYYVFENGKSTKELCLTITGRWRY